MGGLTRSDRDPRRGPSEHRQLGRLWAHDAHDDDHHDDDDDETTLTTTTIPATTTTTIPGTTNMTQAGSTTTTEPGTTTTTAGGQRSAAGPTTTAARPTSTLPHTGGGPNTNTIGVAVLILLAGALATMVARRQVS